MYIPPFTVSSEAINLIAEISAQIDDHNTGNADKTADNFADSHTVASETDGGEYNGAKSGNRSEQRGFGTADSYQADIKQQILQIGLQEGEQRDRQEIPFMQPHFAGRDTQSDQQHDHSGERESCAGKDQGRGDVTAPDVKELIADLDTRKSSSPQQGTADRHCRDKKRVGEEFLFP